MLQREYNMKITIEELQEYLYDHYKNGGIDQSMFMKLVEEIGEVAEVLNKKAGRKSAGEEDLHTQLGNELADVIHYALAIAALNGIDMNDIIIRKDKAASIKYNHKTNLEQFVKDKRTQIATNNILFSQKFLILSKQKRVVFMEGVPLLMLTMELFAKEWKRKEALNE